MEGAHAHSHIHTICTHGNEIGLKDAREIYYMLYTIQYTIHPLNK